MSVSPRRLLTVFGVLALVAAALATPLGLSASDGITSGKFALAGTGLLALVAGLLGRRTLPVYKAVALMAVNTLVVLLLLELSLLGLARLGDFVGADDSPGTDATRYVDDGRERLPYYEGLPWAETYWSEYHRVWGPESRYLHPYLLWKVRPFAGETINIDAEGHRVTPASRCNGAEPTVWMLGGSTTWGTGVPDWGTIPELLARRLEADGEGPVCVRNLAEQGYGSTQEMLQLLFRLREGRRPDIVVWYDGINDVFSSYQSGRADWPQNFAELEAAVGGVERTPATAPSLLAPLERTRTVRLARRLTGREHDPREAIRPERRGIVTAELAAQTAGAAISNYLLAERLGAAWGFRSIVFWQPLLLLDAKPPTDDESQILEVARAVYPGLEDLLARTYSEVGRRAVEAGIDWHDLRGLFADREELVYIDPWHVTHEANAAIADAIAARLTGQ